jgi:hypothetical protein
MDNYVRLDQYGNVICDSDRNRYYYYASSIIPEELFEI